ncbi:WD40-repeat-containing domain protein [Suillus bovinus]|uniref:WD40-repeat-containing domain protein n=1 Tax=Suillus bovinus TaxID=48563 RepID=UPI001B872783|nr:WD40-repeat-containing domain protein [Suillus bovinus]KAG2158930.1 WD40-repeat-containing domain protein [Suillus bovinus]
MDGTCIWSEDCLLESRCSASLEWILRWDCKAMGCRERRCTNRRGPGDRNRDWVHWDTGVRDAAVYSPDMTLIATSGYHVPYEYLIKIWDANTGELVVTLEGHTHWSCLAWTKDGKTLVSGSHDRSMTRSTTTWTQIAVLEGHTDFVYGIAISPNSRILASASADNTARLWSLDNGQPINSPLHHADTVRCVSFSTDGKLLLSGCENSNVNVCAWDVCAILREPRLANLMEQSEHDKWITSIKSHRLPRGFFGDTPNPAHSSARNSLHPSPQSHGSTLRSRFLSLFRPTPSDARDTLSRARHFHWARNHLPARTSSVDIELPECFSAVVDAPCARGKRRTACARERRTPLIPKNTIAGSSRPLNGTVIDAAQAQSASQPHSTVFTSTAPLAVAHTTSSINPQATIKHAGLWTRFWLFICCTSPEYIDGHH